jgi:1-deoxy-D-xylulose-5-phosphate synthase
MAVASKYLKDDQRNHIAVIGDGAMTGGIAFEALNHTGVTNANLLIVLNDNCMSIDPNVGALKDYLTDITTSHAYNKLKDEVWNMLGKISRFGKSARDVISNIEGSLKSFLLSHSNLFQSFNIRYFGPVDGHDVDHLVHIFKDLKSIPGPKILHCITVKGKGFPLAEKDQTKWHAPGSFDKITGEIHVKVYDKPQPPKYQDVFGKTLVELAGKNDKIMGITPAMPSGSSMNIMMKEMPGRAFDVGIAEQHAVTFSAGLAVRGMIPFCNIYSTFLQRAYDQVIHDVCIQDLRVVFCLDRAGLVGADGPTHHGVYDIAYLRALPNLIVSSPMDEIELRNLMYTAQSGNVDHPISIRYPRGQGVHSNWKQEMKEIPVGKGRIIREGNDIAILSFGHIGNFAVSASRELLKSGIDAAHYDMRFVKPLDAEMLHEIFNRFDKIITIEDGCLTGGFGSAILEFMADNQYKSSVRRIGIPDRVVDHGEPADLYRECGMDVDGIRKAVVAMLMPATDVK